MTAKPPTAREAFDARTCLMVYAMARDVMENQQTAVKPDDVAWFCTHCDKFVRWLHANRADWRQALEGKRKGSDPRDWLRGWLEHWAAAFVLNPLQFKQRRSGIPLKNTVVGAQNRWLSRKPGITW